MRPGFLVAKVYRKDVDVRQLACRALVEDLEAANRDDLVTPQLDPDRVRGTEGKEVHDTTSHRELADLLHEGRASEAPVQQGL